MGKFLPKPHQQEVHFCLTRDVFSLDQKLSFKFLLYKHTQTIFFSIFLQCSWLQWCACMKLHKILNLFLLTYSCLSFWKKTMNRSTHHLTLTLHIFHHNLFICYHINRLNLLNIFCGVSPHPLLYTYICLPFKRQ